MLTRDKRIGQFTSLSEPLRLRIIGFLDPLSKKCLQLTNKCFRDSIQSNGADLTGCAKWLVMAYLEQEELDRVVTSESTITGNSGRRKLNIKLPFRNRSSSSSMPNTFAKLTCALCKTKHGPASFLKGADRSQALVPKGTDDLLRPRSLQRICAWHYGKIVRIKFVRHPDQTVFFGRWISSMQPMCLHCGIIVEHDKCGCLEQCNVCPKAKMRIYERIRRTGETGTIDWTFKRGEDGDLNVNEKRTSSKGEKIVRLPVEYR